MSKILLISGSPRKGNTDFVLDKIFAGISGDKEIIYLKDKNIKHCCGCLNCDTNKTCLINDDMQAIYKKMLDADIFIIGTPNYFDNVPGLLKDFIDRTNPFYETDKLKGKKLIAIVVGGGGKANSKRICSQALKYFADCHQLDLVDSFIFQALQVGELSKNKVNLEKIDEFINKIKLQFKD